MATRNVKRNGVLLSFALSLLGCAWNVALADDAPAAIPAATPAPQAAEPAKQDAPAAAPVKQDTAAAPAAEESKETKKKVREKKPIRKGMNFEQLEKHKDEGYYGSMQTPMHKGDDYEQIERHKDDKEGYYSIIPQTPKEYHNVTPVPVAPPVVVTPPPVQPPVERPTSSDPGRKFDDDPGKEGSITYTRHVKTAREMLNGGHFDLAKNHFKEALHILPDQLDVYPDLIEACRKSNDWSEAGRAIQKLEELDPKRAKEYDWQYGEAMFNLVKWDKAQPVLKKSLAHGHHQEQIHRMLLTIAKQQKNNADVLTEYAALTKLKPGDYQLRMDYAAMLELAAKPQEAIAQYRAAINNNPTDGATMGRIAYMLMYHNKDYDGAMAMYNKAIAADPRNAKTYQDGINYCAQQKQAALSAAAPKKK